jgi:hypothetical protein
VHCHLDIVTYEIYHHQLQSQKEVFLSQPRWVFHCFCLSSANQTKPFKTGGSQSNGCKLFHILSFFYFSCRLDQLTQRKPFIMCIKRNAFRHPFLRHEANKLTYKAAVVKWLSYYKMYHGCGTLHQRIARTTIFTVS